LLLGNSNATHPQAPPPPATAHETRAELRETEFAASKDRSLLTSGWVERVPHSRRERESATHKERERELKEME
jgi:hypothetical protein